MMERCEDTVIAGLVPVIHWRFNPAVPHYVYILASRKHGTLYIGVTNDIVRRVYEHKAKLVGGFTSRYGVDRLVWLEAFESISVAIQREKTMKSWPRAWKIRTIERDNPGWRDLFDDVNK